LKSSETIVVADATRRLLPNVRPMFRRVKSSR